jgi:BolA protein
MTMQDTLQSKLAAQFSPESIEIMDESYKHRGHAGFKPEGETHFKIAMVSVRFEGKTRVERQRMVFDVLKEEMQHRIHALSLHLQTPEEFAGNASPSPAMAG